MLLLVNPLDLRKLIEQFISVPITITGKILKKIILRSFFLGGNNRTDPQRYRN